MLGSWGVLFGGAGPTGVVEDERVRGWFDEAELIARGMEDVAERKSALQMVVAVYADCGYFEGARVLADSFASKEKNQCLQFIAVGQAQSGEVEAALATAGSIDDLKLRERATRSVATICAKKDITTALRIAGDIGEPGRSGAYAEIVESQVLAGDLDGAQVTFSGIVDDEHKAEAKLWIVAGKIAREDDFKAAAEKAGVDLEGVNGLLEDIAEVKLKNGELMQAQKILGQLSVVEARARGYIALAEYQLGQGMKDDFKKSIEQALAETARINDPVMQHVCKTANYTQIAGLQIVAGDCDNGLNTLKMARKIIDDEAERSLLGDFIGMMGGRKDVCELLYAGGRVEEVEEMAGQADSAMRPYAVATLARNYVCEGKIDKLNELLESARSEREKFDVYMAAIEGV